MESLHCLQPLLVFNLHESHGPLSLLNELVHFHRGPSHFEWASIPLIVHSRFFLWSGDVYKSHFSPFYSFPKQLHKPSNKSTSNRPSNKKTNQKCNLSSHLQSKIRTAPSPVMIPAQEVSLVSSHFCPSLTGCRHRDVSLCEAYNFPNVTQPLNTSVAHGGRSL